MAEDKMKNLSRESLAAESDQTLSILVPHREYTSNLYLNFLLSWNIWKNKNLHFLNLN